MLGTLCTLITALTCVDAVIVLTQTPAVHTVSTGQEVVLNCNVERDFSNYVSWYKQVPGEAPQYVLRFHRSSSPDFGSGFSSDRFNSKASTTIDFQFIIKQAEAGDSAQYYYVSWLSAGSPVSSGISSSTAVQQPDKTFKISSYLSVQTSDWNMDKVYTCKVTQGSQTSEQNIKKSECPAEQ
ncbi:putative non-functional immunoglobulin kappa variable 6D-41 [Dissostichus eleginoides]|nr:putative non-functional immunoglobulin kappa variable 6D-41 [Dissostichus eleginoides]